MSKMAIRKMVLGEVLQLDQPAGPSARTVGTVKLEHAVSSAVSADCVLYCLIFLHGGFCKLLSEHESGLDSLVIRITDQEKCIEGKTTRAEIAKEINI